MSRDAFLIGLAQIAFAAPGLVSVVGLLQNGRSRWSPAERIGLTMIFELASGLLLASLLPFILRGALSDRSTWRVASLLLAMFVFGVGISQIRRVRRGHSPRFPRTLYGFIVPAGILGAALIVNGWLASASLYSFGLLLILVAMGVQFWLSFLSQLGTEQEHVSPSPLVGSEPSSPEGLNS